MKLYTKLLEIQKKINGLGQDAKGQTYKYVSGAKVLGAIKPLMNEYGVILKQEIISIENTRQDYVVSVSKELPNGRPKSEINSKVMMRFTWIDCETGERDENLFGANGQNDWDKGLGSALTYAERYFLLKFFHIATDEDDIDNPERKPQEVIKKPVFDSKHKHFKEAHRKISIGEGSVEKLKETYTLSEDTIKLLTSIYTD